MHTKNSWLKLFVACFLVAMVVASAFYVSARTQAAGTQGIGTHGPGDSIGTPKFVDMPAKVGASRMRAAVAGNHASQLVDTVPFWSSVFTYNNNIYPYQMVGTDPSAGSATSVVNTKIIPLKFTFSTGASLDGTQKVLPTIASPLFVPSKYSSGFTQYGDAMQRAEFWKYVSKTSPNYHAYLNAPDVTPTVTLNVPAASGQITKGKRTGASLGLVDITWFDTQVQSLLTSMHISPKTFPIFLDYNTFLYQGDPTQCCILGYHSAVYNTTASGQSQIATYSFAAYSDPGIFGALPIEDVHALSHEVSEWYNDPFVDNLVPNWSVPNAPQYGCNNFLEVGDPAVGIAIPIRGYHPQDEVFFSFFAKQVPSIGIDGRYDYLGQFAGPSPVCSMGATPGK